MKIIVSNSTLLEEIGVLEPDIDSANNSLYSLTNHLVWSLWNECWTQIF